MCDYLNDYNLDKEVIDGFGQDWATFNYTDGSTNDALNEQFLAYTAPFDLKIFKTTRL